MSATPIVMGYHSVLGTNVATMYQVSTQLNCFRTENSSHKSQPSTCGDFVADRVWIRAEGPAGRQIRVNALTRASHGCGHRQQIDLVRSFAVTLVLRPAVEQSVFR
jgi:hypothetical protein